jgi:hypothetical protein
LASGSILVEFIDIEPSNATFVSVSLRVGYSPSSFAPVSGYIVMETLVDHWMDQYRLNHPNTSSPSLIIALKHPGSGRPYFEVRAKFIVEKYQPSAIVVIGGM